MTESVDIQRPAGYRWHQGDARGVRDVRGIGAVRGVLVARGAFGADRECRYLGQQGIGSIRVS